MEPVWGSGWRDWGIIQIPAETWCDHKILCVAGKKIKNKTPSPSYKTFYLAKIRRFVRRAEGQCRIFLFPTRSQSLHTIAPPENVTFPLQAHLPVFFYPLIIMTRITSSTGMTAQLQDSRQSSSRQAVREVWKGSCLHLLFWSVSSSLCPWDARSVNTALPTFSEQDRRTGLQVQHSYWSPRGGSGASRGPLEVGNMAVTAIQDTEVMSSILGPFLEMLGLRWAICMGL